LRHEANHRSSSDVDRLGLGAPGHADGWDSKGWVKLGERTVEVTFGNGERFHPAVRYSFREGSRTHLIDLLDADLH